MNENLGRKAVDKITGFSGVITGHAEYLTGCDQFLVQPSCDKGANAKYPEAIWFDSGRLNITVIEVKKETVKGKRNGCDYSAPIK